ncbi:MAG TPA: kynureninase [Acidimicrobiia bacterium]|nr:kynureninase [Acidimicrobiia bacterium]
MVTRDDCRALDAADPLAPIRDRFVIPPGVIYLDGNSLGMMPVGVGEAVAKVVEQWSTHLIAGWWEDDWLGMPVRIGARLEGLLGAEPGTVICTDSTSVNLYKLVTMACSLRPGRILTDHGNFPTDLYILESVARAQGRELLKVEPEELAGAITTEVGVVAATHVDFRTGRRHDLAGVSRRAREVGALTVWDLSHSTGAMPVDVAAHQVDFAVGCGYKYLNGGPGAPAYLYVSPNHLTTALNPITGWFAHARPFDFSPQFIPAEGIGRLRVGTPDIVAMAALEAALTVWEGIDLAAVRSKSEGLTSLFIDLVDQQLAGVRVVTPRRAEERGSQVSLKMGSARQVMDELARRGVVGDFRPPDLLRFGLAPLYIRYVDVWDAAALIGSVG